MIELFRMWRYTKMVVLTAFSAALYAAILIPFKVVIPLIPGFTEFRPANAIPIITSIFFGPAGTWGSAIGNFIGDALGGTLGLGSIFGFFGNFLYGLIPYKILYPETLKSKNLPLLVFIILNASLVCAVVIGWGVDLLGLVPFAALGSIIFLNNFIVAVILAPVLVNIFHKRLVAWGLLYTEIMDKADLPTVKSPLVKKLGIGLLLIGGASGIIIGNLISIGIYKSSLLAFGFAQGAKGEIGIFLGLVPSLIIILLALFLL